MFSVAQKLKLYRASLCHWNRDQFQGKHREIQQLKIKLEEIYENPQIEENCQNEQFILNRLKDLWNREESYWKQRSRIQWLIEGDRNTRFFHVSTIQRRHRNSIVKLQKVDDEEIKRIVFDLGGLKSPGSDGFPGLFYQRSSDVVENDICIAVQSFFASRLKPMMDALISVDQTAFIPHRSIQDNIVIAHEALSCLISKAHQDGFLKGIQLARRTPALTNSLFADDILLFGRVTRAEAMATMDIISKYSTASGQQVNVHKSSIFFSKRTPGRSKTPALNFLKEKIEAKTQSLKQKLLSQEGRETLIKVVLCAIPMYTMSILKLPKNFCSQLNSLVANFWWGKLDQERKMHWISWKSTSKLKSKGGMGFKDFELLNLACLAKQSWRLINHPNSLWARVIKGLYFPNSSFWNASASKKNKSWIWQSLLASRDVLKEGFRHNIGDGSDTLAWFDPWIPLIPKFRVNHLAHCSTNINKVANLIDHTSLKWKMDLIDNLFEEEVAQAIKLIPIAPMGSSDTYVWHFDSSGNYSVKSRYRFLVEKQRVSNPQIPSHQWAEPNPQQLAMPLFTMGDSLTQ
ncbi:uncharacterized protein LOC131175927 [Hevea brasiliensis]|uniref:uncharacterized protein LOC131175927 n=1 Tax=Hevea brasiliensis TaxID=3981 RepID=UPI0025EB1430|nr:uncharacterized protein LOC131175927 [Hevea brasiliensis]